MRDQDLIKNLRLLSSKGLELKKKSIYWLILTFKYKELAYTVIFYSNIFIYLFGRLAFFGKNKIRKNVKRKMIESYVV